MTIPEATSISSDAEKVETLNAIAAKLDELDLRSEASAVRYKAQAIANGSPILSVETIYKRILEDTVAQDLIKDFNDSCLREDGTPRSVAHNIELHCILSDLYIRVLELSGGVADRQQTNRIVAKSASISISDMPYIAISVQAEKRAANDPMNSSRLMVVPTANVKAMF